MVVMNAATSIITTKSPYMVRTSVTMPQVNEPLGAWALQERHQARSTRWSPTTVPATTPRARSSAAFKEAGGEIVGSVRFPVANPDFSAFVQRAKDLNPEAIFIFVPGGAQPAAIGKALAERGIDPKKTKVLGQGELTDDEALKSMGDAALGIITAFHYDYNHDVRDEQGVRRRTTTPTTRRNPDIFSIGGYDGMHLIYEALKKTGGKTDGEALIAAAKGMEWESPRGPMSIDPETRDIIQTVYIRRVEKVGGQAGQRRVRQGRERQGPGRRRAMKKLSRPSRALRCARAEGGRASRQ